MGRVVRRALGGLLVAGLVAASFAFYTYSPYLTLTIPVGPPTTAEPASSPTAGGRRSAAPTPTPTPTPTPSAADAGRPVDPGRRDPGIRLVATVRAGAVFAVTETVRLPKPVTTLTLMPPDLQPAGGVLRSARASATNVVVRVDDRTIRLSRETVRGKRTVNLGRATDRLKVSYRLHGTIRVNRRSSAGRAIGAVGPLVGRVPVGLPVAISLPGRAVSNVSCVCLPAEQRNCFAGDQPKVRVARHLPHSLALVVVQLDLGRVPGGG